MIPGYSAGGEAASGEGSARVILTRASVSVMQTRLHTPEMGFFMREGLPDATAI